MAAGLAVASEIRQPADDSNNNNPRKGGVMKKQILMAIFAVSLIDEDEFLAKALNL
jgi:hypothetical protein